MSEELFFRTDLFRGTAPYYDRYRSPYPQPLFDGLCGRLPVSGRGRLLDLACGTGYIAFPLASRFKEVVAIDQEAEMVAFGAAKAAEAGVENITWAAGSAETAPVSGPFELITIGNAFHRVKRRVVAERMLAWLQPGGGVALVWGSGPWRGGLEWQRAADELIRRWLAKLGAEDRVPADWEAVIDRTPHEQILAEAGFDYAGRFDFSAEETWTVQSLTGYMYSTSGLNREALGGQIGAFERELADLLLSHNASDRFEVAVSYAYELARKISPLA
jgi:SAM-dependent methyltransferase